MTLDNVLPIDAESAKILARRDIRFRWFVAALTTAWLAALIPAVALSPLPPLGMLTVLVAFALLAEHRFVLFSDETSMSASIIVIVASVMIFGETCSAVGVALVASSAGLYLQHVRHRAFGKIAVNASVMGLSALGAFAVGVGLNVLSTDTPSVLRAAAISTTYWAINNVAVATHQAITRRATWTSDVRALLFSDMEPLAWAFTCAIAVTAARGHPWVQLVLVATFVLAQVSSERLDIASPAVNRAELLSFGIWIGLLGILALHGAVAQWSFTMVAAVAVMSDWFRNPRRGSFPGSISIALVALVPWSALFVLAIACALVILRLTNGRGFTWSHALLVGVLAAKALIEALPVGVSLAPRVAAVVVASFCTMTIAMLMYASVLARSLHRHRSWTLTLGLTLPCRAHFFGITICCSLGMVGLANRALVIPALALVFGWYLLANKVKFRRTSGAASP